MEAVEKTILLKDEMIMELLELLVQNNMSKEANDTFEICAYIDSLERKLDTMTEELTKVKEQLKDMQEDTVLNNLKVQVQAAAERLQEKRKFLRSLLDWRKSIFLSFGFDPLNCTECGMSMLALEVYYKKLHYLNNIERACALDTLYA